MDGEGPQMMCVSPVPFFERGHPLRLALALRLPSGAGVSLPRTWILTTGERSTRRSSHRPRRLGSGRPAPARSSGAPVPSSSDNTGIGQGEGRADSGKLLWQGTVVEGGWVRERASLFGSVWAWAPGGAVDWSAPPGAGEVTIGMADTRLPSHTTVGTGPYTAMRLAVKLGGRGDARQGAVAISRGSNLQGRAPGEAGKVRSAGWPSESPAASPGQGEAENGSKT